MQPDRRAALARLAIFALAPASCLSLGRPATALPARIVAPDRPFILRRELVRELSGDAAIVVIREWSGEFELMEAGLRATGSQASCTVEAPEMLAPIAQIERQRVAPGPFPAIIGSDGRIIDAKVENATVRSAAVAAAQSIIDALGQPSDRDNSRVFLASLAERSGAIISATPADLFFPSVGRAEEMRPLSLPGGLTGQVTVELSASAQTGGLLDMLQRRIVTRIDNSTRTSRERWSLRLT